MALKDWIKTIDSKKYGPQFRRRSDYLGVRIDTFKPSKYGYDVVVAESNNRLVEDKHFKSKALAFKYAKDYMRRH